MASKQSSVDFVLEQMSGAGPVAARKMLGEYGIYCRDKVVALLCDNQLYVKPTLAGKAFIGEAEEGFPYPGAKAWFLVAGDLWEDRDWLSRLIQITADELPLPKAKKPKSEAKARAEGRKKTKSGPRTPANHRARQSPGRVP